MRTKWAAVTDVTDFVGMDALCGGLVTCSNLQDYPYVGWLTDRLTEFRTAVLLRYGLLE